MTGSGFGARLRELCNERGISQSELARLIGVSPSDVSRYMSDGQEPSFPNLMAIRSTLGCTWDELLGESLTPEESEPEPEPEPDPRTLLAHAREQAELVAEQSDETTRQLWAVLKAELDAAESTGSPSAAAKVFGAERWPTFLGNYLGQVEVHARQLESSVRFIQAAPGAAEVAIVAEDQARACRSMVLWLQTLEVAARLVAALGKGA